MSTDHHSDPLVPGQVDLRDFPFTPIFRARLFGSAFHARANDGEWRAGVTLWLKSWDQVPAGTLPDDDIDLCRLAELGRDMKTWRKLKPGALRGWARCSDGRLHHKVVAEGVMEAWERKITQRFKTECARIKKANQRGGTQPMPVWEEFAAAHGITGQTINVPEDVVQMSPGTNDARPDDIAPDVPQDTAALSPGKSPPRDRDRDRDRDNRSSRIVESSAGGRPPACAHEAGPPADSLDDGISAVRQGVADGFERWFDLPDRPISPADGELFADWIAAGAERGLSPADTAVAVVEEVQRQFRQLAGKDAGPPRSLRAVLDRDVRTAIANARPAKSATSLVPVPDPYAGHFDAVEWHAWLASCRITTADGVATVAAPTRMHRDRIAQHLASRLMAALGAQDIEVIVVDKGQGRNAA